MERLARVPAPIGDGRCDSQSNCAGSVAMLHDVAGVPSECARTSNLAAEIEEWVEVIGN